MAKGIDPIRLIYRILSMVLLFRAASKGGAGGAAGFLARGYAHKTLARAMRPRGRRRGW